MPADVAQLVKVFVKIAELAGQGAVLQQCVQALAHFVQMVVQGALHGHTVGEDHDGLRLYIIHGAGEFRVDQRGIAVCGGEQSTPAKGIGVLL